MVDRREQIELSKDSSVLKFEWAADDVEAMRDFKCGIRLLREKSYFGALAYFRRAHELELDNPYFLSYMGLALAHAERKWEEAGRLCETALRMKRNQAQLYLNCAEVFLLAGRRGEAVEAIEVGIAHAPSDARLRRMMNTMGVRRPAIIPFLSRGNSLNRTLGRLRHGIRKIF